nr:expressed protein [Hymenolepis microstoma]
MSEFYEYESSCTRCLRSSPLGALLLMILVFLGATAFGVGTVFGRKRLHELLNADHLFPYMDYTVYGIVGVTGLFALIVYIICTVSSGWNAKRWFEGTRATRCGRCMNLTLIACLVSAVIFWTLISCLLTYPLMSSALLLYRNDGPARSVASEAASVVRAARQAEPRAAPPAGLDVDPSAVISDYFTCDPNKVDFSYYGLYGTDGKPLLLDSTDLGTKLRTPLTFVCIAFLGSLVIMVAYFLLTCSVAMNYARLKELRYYEPSVNDDETIRLRH